MLVTWLLREAAGPRPYGLDMALRPYLDSASQLVYSVLAMALLAASVNLVVGGRRIAVPRLDPSRDHCARQRNFRRFFFNLVAYCSIRAGIFRIHSGNLLEC